jgi:phosphoglycolate phosphatase
MIEPAPTLILFDIDGTLLSADRSGRAAFELALRELLDLEDNTARISFAGKTDWQVLLDLLVPLGYSEGDIAGLLPEFARLLAEKLASIIDQHRVVALPGALALVESLAHDPRARLGLVTGNVSHSVPIKLRAAGFDPAYFPVGAFGNESANRNDLPPLALRRAVDYWQVDFTPERIVVVGDTPNDVICARAVGARALAVLTGALRRDVLAAEAPHAILDDLTDHDAVRVVLFGEG